MNLGNYDDDGFGQRDKAGGENDQELLIDFFEDNMLEEVNNGILGRESSSKAQETKPQKSQEVLDA